MDYLASPSYTYLDGRGHWFSTDQAGSDGALAVRPVGTNSLEVIHISGREPFQLRRPYGARGVVTQVTTYHVEGRQLSDAPFRDTDSKTRIDLVPNAVRYLVRLTTPP